MLEYFLIQAANGIVIGIMYTLIATGLTIIFALLKIVNFAHGELYMLGGYFGYYVITLAGVPPLPAVLVAMALSFAFAVAVERGLLTPLYSPAMERKSDYGILITFGLRLPPQHSHYRIRAVSAPAALLLRGRPCARRPHHLL